MQLRKTPACELVLTDLCHFVLQQVTQIDADLKIKSQAYNSLKGNLQNLERKATYVSFVYIVS